jgi:hypothetical protein
MENGRKFGAGRWDRGRIWREAKRSMKRWLHATEAELLEVLQGSHAHVAMEVVGEGALIAEAEGAGDVGDVGGFALEGFAGGLDAELHDEGLGTGSEGFDEFAVQLPGGEVDDLGELGDGDAGAEVVADVGEGAVDLEVGLEELLLAFKALHGAHDADDAAFDIGEGELVGDEPVGQALIGEEELDDVELGFAGAEDFFVIAAEVFGEAGGEEIEVVLADDGGFFGDAEAIHEAAAGAHEAEVAVFGKEGEVWQVIEEPVEGGVRTDAADEPFA